MAEVRYKGRITVLVAVVALIFTGIGVRLALLHLRPEAWVREPIKEGRMFEINPVGNRGRIVDRNGEILAMDVATYHVWADPRYISQYGDADTVCRYLAAEFNLPESELQKKLSNTSRQYVRIKKFVPGPQLKRFSDGPYGGVNYALQYPDEEGKTNIFLRGVGLEEAPIRTYPKGPLMAHVVGFANQDGKGSAGVELRMNKYLLGREGRRVSKMDAKKNEIYNTRMVDEPPQDGATVYLTLDQQVQYATEKTIEKMCREFNAKAGWAIVQHVRTGEILAMASYPTYDLNRFSTAPTEWMRNNAISFNYEPGSTMKAAVIASAIDHDIVKESDMIDCEDGYWVYYRTKLEDAGHKFDTLSVSNVVKYSSNIGTAKIALMMGEQLLYDSLKAFHFGDRLDVGIPGEEKGIVNPIKNWSKISITRLGMGHEIATTSLQIISMMSAIAYNGVQMQPYLIKKIVAADGTVLEENEPLEIGRPISPTAARRMQKLLASVTEEGGTGTKARVEDYTVGGKTGTAQKINPAGGYFQKNFTSSFVGFLPVGNPEIAIIVVADDPGTYTENGQKTGYYGGTVCGPAFREIAEFAVRYLRIAPEGNRIYVARPEE